MKVVAADAYQVKQQFGVVYSPLHIDYNELPHEPLLNQSAERWLVAQDEDRLIAIDPRNSYDAIYICKHCGLLYMEDE